LVRLTWSSCCPTQKWSIRPNFVHNSTLKIKKNSYVFIMWTH
jgi:hypothetical protein